MSAGGDPVDGLAGPPLRPEPGPRPAPAAPDDPPASWADLDGAVRSIGAHALKVNLTRAADLQVALRLASTGELDDNRRSAAIEAAHQLMGSAGTFGFPGASDRAGELEHFFMHAVFDEPQLLAATDQLAALLVELATEPDY